MKLDLIIKGGRLVSAAETIHADLGIRGERIAAIGKHLVKTAPNTPRVIDARGRLVIPGGVDAHVHLDLPVGRNVSADDYNSGTRAAASGGVTTVIDFATPNRDESMLQALETWHAKAEGQACVDYAFHMCITNWKRQKRDVRRIIDQGIPTFKQFMIYAERGLQSDDADIFEALETLRDLNGMLCVHAESGAVLDLLIKRHHTPDQMKKLGVRLHPLTRPNYIEVEAVSRAIRWAEATGGRLYIVHLSTGAGVDLIERARENGVRVLAETCPHYLVLDEGVFAKKDGHLFATCPQVKSLRDQQRLWRGLKNGVLGSVATDTCTFTRRQKTTWNGDWTKIPMGMPGLETMLPIVYTHGVLKRRLTVNQFVDKCCTTPARVMGLYPRKGVLRVGSDADIAIIHPTRTRKVDWRKMQTNCDWNPYQGWELAGFAEHTICRGCQVVENYQFVGHKGHGRFISRANPGRAK